MSSERGTLNLMSEPYGSFSARDAVKIERLRQALATGLQEAATGQFAGYDLQSLIAELDQEISR